MLGRFAIAIAAVTCAAVSACNADSAKAPSPATPAVGSPAAKAEAGTAKPPPGGAGALPSAADGGGASKAKERKRVVLKGSRGDQVPGLLWLPRRSAGQKFPAVLAMYGIGGNKDDGNIGRAADVLADDGYVVITIDWPGTGERGKIDNVARITDTDVKDWTVGDYGVAVDFLVSLPEVDGQKIGYVGASMGAMTGLAFAGKDQRVKAIAAIVPIPNPLWGSDDPQERIAALPPRASLCISTQDNSDLSGMVCAKAVAPGVTKTLPGGHELQGFKDQVVAEVKAFFAAHLK